MPSPLRSLLSGILLCLAASGAAAQYSSVPGPKCPSGRMGITYEQAQAHNWDICHAMGSWDIARIEGGGSISGRGYNCKVLAEDSRTLGTTVCQPLPPNHEFFTGHCTKQRCGIIERRGGGPRAASGPIHDCSGLVTASLKKQCEARNAAAAEAQKACRQPWGGPDGTGYKGYADCLAGKLPKLPDSLQFTDWDVRRCQDDLRTFCTQRPPRPIDALFPPLPGTSYEDCVKEVRPAACESKPRLYRLCGGPLVFMDAFYREECLIRARQ
jgi:hypothetical protein